jgi:signal transduction histidine kinase/CheY-like chemotaxis protein/ligand-binding sensor domain-containing protein/AraC-like DNA-binding protein
MYLKLFFYLLLLLIPLTLSAQEYSFSSRTLDAKDGLANFIFNDVFIDRDGFAWVATDYGLHRYDGHKFKLFTKEEHGLFDNTIYKIKQDANGNLWLSYYSSLRSNKGHLHIDVFDPITETTTSLKTYLKDRFVFETYSEIISIEQNKDNSIWLGTNEGAIYEYKDSNLEKIFQYDQKKALIRYVLKTPKGNAWIKVNDVFCYIEFDKGKGKISRQFKIRQKRSQQHRKIYTLGNSEAIALLLPRELFVLSPNDSLKVLSYPKTANTHLYKLFPQQQWILAGNKTKKDSFYILDLNGQIIHTLSPTKNAPYIASWEFNMHLSVDQYNNIWECNPLKQNIRIINIKEQKFKKINRDGFSNKTKKHIITNRGILQSSQGDLYITGNKTSKNNQFLSFNGNEIRGVSMLEDRNKKGLWISISHRKGLFYYNYSTEDKIGYTYDDKIEKTKSKTSNIKHQAIHQDQNNQIWLGQKGLVKFDSNKKRLVPYKKYNQFKVLKSANVRDFHENKQGIWVASDKGLFLVDPEKGVIKHFHEQGDAEHKIPHNKINHIHEDQEGLFWLSTTGGGIIRWNPISKEFLQLTTKEGLSHNITYAIYGDDANNLWVSSNYGLMCIEKENFTIRTYLKEDDMTDDEFNAHAHYQAKDGRLYFGGLNGITSFYPKDLRNNHASSYPLQITEFLKRNTKTGVHENHMADLDTNQSINIHPHEQGFFIRFALLDFHDSQRHKYAYKIDGLDSKWNYTQRPEINIENLSHGEFVLRIKAQGLAGRWSKELVYPINSVHFFYFRPWFAILVFVLSMIAIFIGFQWRTRRYKARQVELETIVKQRTQKIEEDKTLIEEQSKELKELDKLKSRFFTNISHELRTPLTLILGPANYLLNNPKTVTKKTTVNTLKSITKNGNSLLQLIEEILDLSKLDAHKLALFEEEIHLQTFLRRVILAFESQATYQEIDFQFEFQAKENLCVQLDLKKVEKIINNLISNAIKYTPPKGLIKIKLSDTLDLLKLEVKDSGQGIHPDDLPHIFERFFQTKQLSQIEQGGTGVGLALSIELAQFMQGSLNVESTYTQGSTFTFSIPKKEVDLNADIIAATNMPVLDAFDFEEEGLVVPQQSQKEFKVLIVEDNHDMRQFVEQLLSDVYTVFSVGNGKRAIEYLEEHEGQIDLIVSDVMMPIMDGFELLNQVKKHPIWRKIPVILLTARADQMDKLQALTTGVDDYLTKPFSNEELLVRTKNLLYNYHQRKLWQIEQEQQDKEVLSIDQFQDRKTIEQPKISEEDQFWIKEVATCVQGNFSNNNFNATQLYLDMHMAEMTFRRRLRKITGLTGNKYLKEFRLQEARKLLEQKKYNTIQQVCYAVGFSDPQYFSKQYKARFGKPPRSYFN